jgi:hypothetical protein
VSGTAQKQSQEVINIEQTWHSQECRFISWLGIFDSGPVTECHR